MAENTPKDVQAAEAAAKVALHLYENKDKKSSGWKGFWEAVKDKCLRFVGALFMEWNGDEWVISIGRVSWWLAFAPALYIFMVAFAATTSVTDAADLVSRDITPNHLTILLTLAAYNFGKKVADTVTAVWGPKGGSTTVEGGGDGPG
jgi:hypothetical protein